MTTPNLALSELAASQAQPHVTVNSALRRLDSIVQCSVLEQSDAPPGSPVDGDRYLVGDSPTGDFIGHEQNVAAYIGTDWQFFAPQIGWIVYNQDAAALYIYGTGSPQIWEELQTGGGGATAVDLGMFFPGNPGSAQLMFKFVATRAFTFPANFTGAYGHIGTNPTGSFAMDVSLEGASIGTITVSTGGVFSFVTAGGTTKAVAAGEVIEIEAPVSTDGTAADIAATLVGALA
jgi:hypothetical protein